MLRLVMAALFRGGFMKPHQGRRFTPIKIQSVDQRYQQQRIQGSVICSKSCPDIPTL